VGCMNKPTRWDKLQATTLAAVKRVQESLGNTALELPNVDRHEMLMELLEEAAQILQEPPRRGQRSPKHPTVQTLACRLCRLTGADNTQLLRALKALVKHFGPDCHERTLQRYVREARQEALDGDT